MTGAPTPNAGCVDCETHGESFFCGLSQKTFKELKSRQGRVLGLQCNGHTGMHLPFINGRARVGKFQDVMASDYLIVIHEVDGVLFGDGSV